MTILAAPPARLEADAPYDALAPVPPPTGPAPDDGHDDRTPIRPVALALSWLLITLVGIALVLIAVAPISEERDQRALLTSYRAQIDAASNQAFGLGGVEVPTEAPPLGASVAIVDVERIGLSRVVVEGTAPEQTRQGPGHVVGTGGPGQPGNSVVVGRRSLLGGAFARLGEVQIDDRILITTDQGRSLYTVTYVGTHAILDERAAASTGVSPAPTTSTRPVTTPEGEDATGSTVGGDDADPPMSGDGPVTVDELYGPSPDDRLTLVTTASGRALGGDEALVVVARLDGQPYAPTPQGGRTGGDDGRDGSTDNVAALLLAALAYLASVISAIWLSRNVPWRSAYLLSAPVLVALTIVLADELAGLLPAWT